SGKLLAQNWRNSKSSRQRYKRKKERKEAAKFRSSLLKCGFFMLQFSVYARIVRGYDKAEVITNKIKSKWPSKGNVRMITITEKQYANMVVLKGEPKNSTEKLSLEKSLFEF
ncbi:CRISPR-associated endonuclease Cas2, partial [Campylobacter sp.]|uniref:CRISPR-associated endonuclease Cas2 n=1 Tax=Campylobacter sp. TaxID=205 RepID=UPI00259CCE92